MADLLELSAEIRTSDDDAATAARARVPAGSGRLAELAGWLAGTAGRRPPEALAARLVVAGPAGAAVTTLAADAALPVHELAGGADAASALDAGVAAADREIDEGAALLLLAAGDPTAASATAIAVVTGAEPVALLPRGAAAVDSATWIAAATALRDRRRHVQPLRHQPARLLAELAHPPLAAACGFVLRCAARRTPLVLDGPAALAAAVLVADLRPRAADWWQVADSGTDPVPARALAHLGQRPVLDLAAGSGTGTAALLALSVLRAAATLSTPEETDA